MNKLLSLVVIVVFTLTINAQEFTIKSDQNAGVFKFETEIIDYGTIENKSSGLRVFKFENVGKAPIIITRAKSSCGCTVPDVPKRPIMPGESAEIKVKYDTKRAGSFSKTITIFSNASESTKTLRIKGKILKLGAETKGSLEKPKSLMSIK